jgi:hypothetical protein
MNGDAIYEAGLPYAFALVPLVMIGALVYGARTGGDFGEAMLNAIVCGVLATVIAGLWPLAVAIAGGVGVGALIYTAAQPRRVRPIAQPDPYLAAAEREVAAIASEDT